MTTTKSQRIANEKVLHQYSAALQRGDLDTCSQIREAHPGLASEIEGLEDADQAETEMQQGTALGGKLPEGPQ